MARSEKLEKNLSKVQSYIDGTYEGKTQVGYSPTDEVRKVGDKWTDSDGYEWEQKEGFRVKNSVMPAVGMFNHQCKSCNKNCSPKMAKPWDRDCFKADGRCYHCQINYEMDLKFESKLKWFAYRRLKDLQNMESIEKDMEQWVDEMTEQRKQNPFDETVANAMANGEVEMSIKNNTQ
tara:strand:- start:3801 stop:4331 length:531 start_codon:yes stop_codon:yes gene_type:complete